jgi:hypothetical protein
VCSKELAHQGDDKYIGHSEFRRLVSSTRVLDGVQRQLTTKAAFTISAAAGMRVSDTLHIKLHEMHVSPEFDTTADTGAPSPWQAETPLLVFGNTQGKGITGRTAMHSIVAHAVATTAAASVIQV